MKEFKVRLFTGVRKDDGATFTYYKVVEELENGTKKYTDLKFTKAVEVLPCEDCVIQVEDESWNLNEKGKYPCFWVKKINKIKTIKE